jgi:methionyl-tRNA formyltransferase
MQLVMMGTGPFAVPTLQALLESPHTVRALVTRPTAVVQTRGKSRPAPNPMRDLAASRDLLILDPPDVNAPDVRIKLAALEPDLLVVCDYGQILSAGTLAVARLGGVNLHGSLLPKYRGAAPVNWAIWQGETETGVTVLHMTSKLDAGPCVAFARTPIGERETALELEARLAQLGVEVVRQSLELLEEWDGRSPIGEVQDSTQATSARRLRKSDGAVNWQESAQQVLRQFRALQPWPGIYSGIRVGSGPPLRIILNQIEAEELDGQHPAGSIAVSDGKRLIVATAKGGISIRRLQPSGRKVMAAEEFLRGHRLQVGDRLLDPGELLSVESAGQQQPAGPQLGRPPR